MMKLCPVLFVIGFLFIAADGAPFGQNELAEAAARGDWSGFQRLQRNKFKLARDRFNQAANFAPDFEGIRSLQPQGPDSQVYGEAQYSFHSSSNVNGQKSEQRGGRRIINKNGVVEEYELP